MLARTHKTLIWERTRHVQQIVPWSELLCGEGVVAVAGAMDAFVFLPQVKAPVWFEVAVIPISA